MSRSVNRKLVKMIKKNSITFSWSSELAASVEYRRLVADAMLSAFIKATASSPLDVSAQQTTFFKISVLSFKLEWLIKTNKALNTLSVRLANEKPE